jgi:hypothetical protein
MDKFKIKLYINDSLTVQSRGQRSLDEVVNDFEKKLYEKMMGRKSGKIRR